MIPVQSSRQHFQYLRTEKAPANSESAAQGSEGSKRFHSAISSDGCQQRKAFSSKKHTSKSTHSTVDTRRGWAASSSASMVCAMQAVSRWFSRQDGEHERAQGSAVPDGGGLHFMKGLKLNNTDQEPGHLKSTHTCTRTRTQSHTAQAFLFATILCTAQTAMLSTWIFATTRKRKAQSAS